jgi:predicted RNase H-like HicB family nuclease
MRRSAQQEHEEFVTADGRDFLCLFQRDAGGGYVVTCEDLPPMLAYGETLAEARAQAVQEIETWVDVCTGVRDSFPWSLPR